jgi:hypothetical protein
VVFQSFWLASRSRAVGSGGPYFSSVIVFRLFFLAGMLFYVGDASSCIPQVLLRSVVKFLSQTPFRFQSQVYIDILFVYGNCKKKCTIAAAEYGQNFQFVQFLIETNCTFFSL